VRIGSRVITTTVAISAGILVLAGNFLPGSGAQAVRFLLLRWTMILAAAALFLGLFNLIWSVHWNRVVDQESGWFYSSLVIVFFLATFILGILFGPDYRIMILIFEYIQLPVEASLIALLSAALVWAGIRMILQRGQVTGYLFMGAAALVLLGSTAWVVSTNSQLAVLLGYAKVWLTQVWTAAGSRGILIGVALGAVTTGLRVLLAADRPYGE
jgi:hypothetical protein